MATHTSSAQTTEATGRRFVQIIDLYTQHPGELERLLNQWRTSSLAREHLVLEVEYEPVVAPSSPAEPMVPSAEAAGVVALLDRPPRFRSTDT